MIHSVVTMLYTALIVLFVVVAVTLVVVACGLILGTGLLFLDYVFDLIIQVIERG